MSVSAGDTVAATGPQGRGRWLGLAVLSLGVSIIIVDATVVNVALPTIIRDLGLGTTQAEWINSVYPLVFAALLLTLGRLGDRVGRRRVFLAGVVVFALASLLAAAAQSGGALIAARVLQGIGGAAILPSTLSSVNATFRGRDRAIAFGVWGSVIGGMAALGPLVGGWLVTDVSWRWIFLINVPIGLVCLVGALRYVPETKDEHAEAGIDWPGIVLSSLGLAFLVFGLIEGQHYGWWNAKEAWSAGPLSASAGGASPVPFAFALGSSGSRRSCGSNGGGSGRAASRCSTSGSSGCAASAWAARRRCSSASASSGSSSSCRCSCRPCWATAH